MKKIAGIVLVAVSLSVYAHFQIVKPSVEVLSKPQLVKLDILFTHPMENGPVMDMGKVKAFGVKVNGKKVDLIDSLKKKTVAGKTAYVAEYMVKQPGDYLFYLEPAPYWEPVEQKMIIHYTKVCVSAMGICEGWDELVGFPVEIEPLTRPYGIYTGNNFRGIVKHNGKPVPFAEIEVEYLNDLKTFTSPDDTFTTQVIKADSNGVFSYTMPQAGWWGFAALVDGDEKMKNPAGKDVDVELGGLIWVHCRDMVKTKK